MIYLPCTRTHFHLLHCTWEFTKKKYLIEEGKQIWQGSYTSQDNKHDKLRKPNQFTMVVVWSEPNMHAIPWTIPLM